MCWVKKLGSCLNENFYQMIAQSFTLSEGKALDALQAIDVQRSLPSAGTYLVLSTTFSPRSWTAPMTSSSRSKTFW